MNINPMLFSQKASGYFRHRGLKSQRFAVLPRSLALGTAEWSVWMDSNHRPHAYQACALTTWATNRYSHSFGFGSSIVFSSSRLSPSSLHKWIVKSEEWKVKSKSSLREDWWRWWGSNPWPPACRAGALPAELHPHYHGLTFFKDHLWSPKIEQQKLPYACFRSRQSTTVNSWKSTMVSIERRWSSRTFRYGYLVTT